MSFFKIVTLVARSTESSNIITALTKVRCGNTSVLIIENPSFRAFKANLVIPIPNTTA